MLFTIDGRVVGLDRDKAGKADVSRGALHWMTSMEGSIAVQAWCGGFLNNHI
jgi:hypothetical protein